MGPQTNMAIVVVPAVAQQRIERASAKRKTGPHATKAVTLLSIKKCLEILCCICKNNPFLALVVKCMFAVLQGWRMRVAANH